MLGWWTAASWAVKIGIVVGILAAFVGFGWLVYNTLYHWGYDEAKLEDAPIITKLTLERDNAVSDLKYAVTLNQTFATELGVLDAKVKEQNDSINKLLTAQIGAELKVRQILLEAAAKEKRLTAEVIRLRQIANSPNITEGDCEEADAILRTLMRDRVRNPA